MLVASRQQKAKGATNQHLLREGLGQHRQLRNCLFSCRSTRPDSLRPRDPACCSSSVLLCLPGAAGVALTGVGEAR